MKAPRIIISIILVLMTLYDFSLHLSDVFGVSNASWSPAVLFGAGAFYWGSTAYTGFWTTYWGIATVLAVMLVTLIIIGDEKNGTK